MPRPRRLSDGPVIKVRVTHDQYLELRAKAQAAGMSMAELLRDHGDQLAVVNRADWRLRTYQLGRIGVNLNQLVHWANIHKSAAEARQVIVALLRLERALRSEYGLDQGEPSP
ncbi:MobC family plasmid mobilization relaxosome protein [Magnetospirillum sp. 15-1]|uniref:MobC family plasmid mobilization relaxosome protein n=1 Tax=Magnetospirillum sp. 15-1 TaxID=1979370 RepID=UPI000BBBFC6F|nr:MobC family plasmid mobilization relaxosome protein [Magnetospirillum sp. 15-1]